MYWKISNRSLTNKKIPSISPLLVNGEMISTSCKKAEVFNKFFCLTMCAVIKQLFFHLLPSESIITSLSIQTNHMVGMNYILK